MHLHIQAGWSATCRSRSAFARSGEPLYLRRHRIRSGEQTIRVTVAREPARIDPYRMVIDGEDDDNVEEVEIGG